MQAFDAILRRYAADLQHYNNRACPIVVKFFAGADFIALSWGENWADLSKDANGYWSGIGWIKEIGGDWLARELNHCPRKALDRGFGDPIKFMRDHFTIIHVK